MGARISGDCLISDNFTLVYVGDCQSDASLKGNTIAEGWGDLIQDRYLKIWGWKKWVSRFGSE